MDSPLARMILTVFGGYLLILLGLMVYEWYTEEFPRRPEKTLPTASVQHPFYHEQALKVLQRYSGLPEGEKDRIKQKIERDLISMEQWLTRLDQSQPGILCLGEFHEESTRAFLAEEFFSRVEFDVFLLEATSSELQRLKRKKRAGKEYFPLLDADIMNVLGAVLARNPDITICGIEETRSQEQEQKETGGSRDQSIARNFWKSFQSGQRHAILFGAAHCASDPNWLFGRLHSQAPDSLKQDMQNVRVLGEHQSGPLEGFVFFVDEIGIKTKHFVLPDTSSLDPRLCEWFSVLRQQILKKFQTLIVFRN